MRYFGKIIGIIFGIITGAHIWSIVISLIIGHAYDKATEQQKLEKTNFKHKDNSRQAIFFISTFQILGHLTKSKGRVTELDIKLVTNLMNQMKLHNYARLYAQNAFTEGKNKNFPLRGTLRKLRRACFGRFDLIQMFIEIQIQAAFADGILHPNERKILLIIVEELGISHDQFKYFLNIIGGGGNNNFYNYHNYSSSSSYSHSNNCHTNDKNKLFLNACKILGVQPDDEQIKIKRAYRKLMSEYHPDKMIAKGFPPEMMNIAKQKTQSIQAAYDLIKKERKFN